ncbi:MAG: ribose-5-phosphate isomerase RpiA, partial [Pseudomonadota bacterium]
LMGVPTSIATGAQASGLGIALTSLETVPELDMTVDGADEVDPALRLIKGGGGALLREKIVAAASARMVVIADRSKEVDTLGAFPLPVEIVRFGAEATLARVAAVLERQDVDAREITRRRDERGLFVTDEGHEILDLNLDRIGDPEALDRALLDIPGVVETGLFLDIASATVIGHTDGTVTERTRPA